MIILSRFTKFCTFSLLLLHYSKFYCKFLNSFEFCKIQTHNLKAMAKDKKVNIAVTYLLVYEGLIESMSLLSVLLCFMPILKGFNIKMYLGIV